MAHVKTAPDHQSGGMFRRSILSAVYLQSEVSWKISQTRNPSRAFRGLLQAGPKPDPFDSWIKVQ